MTAKEKKLLLKDLCARLRFGVKVLVQSYKGTFNGTLVTVTTKLSDTLGEAWIEETNEALWCDYKLFKPYLRPMSSMTKKERDKLQSLHDIISNENYGDGYSPAAWEAISEWVDYCNSRHLDYHGLISMGLALEAPEGMYV